MTQTSPTSCAVRFASRGAICSAMLMLCVAAASGGPIDSDVFKAQRLLLTGKYAEAEEAFRQLSKAVPVESAIGLARCQVATGRRDSAEKHLEATRSKHPRSAWLLAELALLKLELGKLDEAGISADAAVRIDNDNVQARWVQAELDRLAGRYGEAEAKYKWFVDHYNQTDRFHNPETLHYIGKATAQYARWNGLSDQFKFLVNNLYPETIKLQQNYWPAHLESGLLFLEKYNQADAANSLRDAEALNPQAAEVHAAFAELALQRYDLAEAQRRIDRALEINPRLLRAHQLQCDVHLANFDIDRAREACLEAIELNPISQGTLGRIIATEVGREGWNGEQNGGKATQWIAAAKKHSDKPGALYESVGDALDLLRRYPAAAEFYALAIDNSHGMAGPRGKLGMMQMRLGDEASAAKLLKASFEADPFNVRVSNTLKVLEVLGDYATIETDHFIIRFDRGQDELLAKQTAKYLEDEVYPEVCQALGYEPSGKSLFEIFSRARNTTGHGWFSARMVGLPYVGTVGACAGRVVAMQSPGDAERPFNWARVLRHEFVHVVNLQQTGFAIPHWFTEALAVHHEDAPRPAGWNEVLRKAAHSNSLFDLATINRGFIRPKSADEWTLAYFQAALYAEYMLDRFGPDAHAKMLDEYAKFQTTPDAIQQSFGVDVAEFEHGYAEHVAKLVAKLPSPPGETARRIEDLQAVHAEKPGDLNAAAELAQGHFNRRNMKQARQLASGVLEKDPNHPLATYVFVQLRLRGGETDGVFEQLELALDRETPQPNLLGLLAGLRYKAKQYDEAIELYQLGVEKFPHDPKWIKTLAQVALRAGDDERLYEALQKLAALDFDDATTRKKLAEIAQSRGDHAAAVRWCREVLQIDVLDATIHHLLGQSLLAQGRRDDAIDALEIAVQLAPEEEAFQQSLKSARNRGK